MRNEDLYIKDQLTSLYSKNFFIENMDNFSLQMIRGLMKNAKEGNDDKTWALMFCDVVGLKLLNDTKGHLVGDEILKYVADVINKSIRTNRDHNDSVINPINSNNNIPIRFGGDEFLIILPNCTKEEAVIVQNRIKQELSNNQQLTQNIDLSIGIADTKEIKVPINVEDENELDTFIETLISTAEERMYADKNKHFDLLTIEERQTRLLKQLNRIAIENGFDLRNSEDINIIINMLNNLQKTSIAKKE